MKIRRFNSNIRQKKQNSLLVAIALIILPGWLNAQENTISGNVFDTGGNPLAYATAVLLDPADSTMRYYAISDETGAFQITPVEQGSYLMQVAFMGYNTVYKNITIPEATRSPFVFAMEKKSMELGEVEVVGEAVPLLINGDTIEYKRAAYKLQEGAVVEDLLKKLPGVEVDRAGNVKAMGEDVQQVYVDGKEFFGRDPKMATKNIPAEAVDKVQMYDKKSDDAEFTGVDDGSRQKSMNIVMEDDMKNLLFGSLSAGGGIPSVYQGKVKAFYHTEKMNFALLGNLNNINDPGFSFSDYMSFRGGALTLMTGAGPPPIGGSSSLPVNFGQTVYGLNTSGAGGINISHSTGKYNRFYVSYMTSFVQRMLTENRYSRNYTSQDVYERNSGSEQHKADTMRIGNIGLKRRIDSTTNFSVNLSANLSDGGSDVQRTGSASSGGTTLNELVAQELNINNRKGISGSGSFVEILSQGRTILKFNASGSYSKNYDLTDLLQSTTFFNPARMITGQPYQSNDSRDANYSASTVLVQKVGRISFLEPGFSFGGTQSRLSREQGLNGEEGPATDSLSPIAEQQFVTYTPSIGLRINNDKNKFNLRLKYQFARLLSSVNNDALPDQDYRYLLPVMNYEHTFSTGRRLNVSYDGSINEPALLQRVPTVNTLDPLYKMRGNPDLKPEYRHSVNTHLFIFDQFSFTSVFAGLRAAYTTNRISLSRTIDDQFVQTIMPVNMDYGMDVNGSVDFSTPIRKLGVKVRLSLQESLSRGLSLVNEQENLFTSMTHDVVFSVENRTKKKWDLESGVGFRLTDSEYSLRDDLNDVYYDLNWFGDITWTPGKNFDIGMSADIMNYNQRSFSESVLIPYLRAEMNVHIPPLRRATLSFSVNDILDKDTGLQRVSELNYLSEVRRNILGRYALLTFTWKLNKTEKQGGNLEIEVNSGRRR